MKSYNVNITVQLLFSVLLCSSASAQIERVWLTHKSNHPNRIVVNWTTKEPGNSVVRFGLTNQYGDEKQIAGNRTLHHVEIPLLEKNTVYHYSVRTGEHRSQDAIFKAYPTEVLRAVVIGNWTKKSDISAIRRDDPHLLLTAGDNISDIYQLCGIGNKECFKAYAQLIDRHPDLFQSTPFMPILGNHDKQIRPRGDRPPEDPVYDVDATAFRRFFELPDDEWKWHFDIPDFKVRFIALDLNHISDMGTTWQSCHEFHKGSKQFQWYRKLMDEGAPQRFVVTLYNESNLSTRTQEDGTWHDLIRQGTLAITGFGYFAERAEVDGFGYYNTSINGKGTRYPDPHSKFFASTDSYLLLTITKKPLKMTVEIKGLDGTVLDRQEYFEQDRRE